MTTLAAVDLGAQSGRVAIGTFDGERLDLTEVHRFPNVPVRVGDRLSWDIVGLYEDVLDGLRKAGREAGRLDSIAVDSWAVDFGLLDARGKLVQNPTHYRDRRRAAAMDGVLAKVPARELYERTGIQLLPINTIFELGAMAAERDPALGAAETLLLIPDLLNHWLCGSVSSEFTNATTTQCFDPRSGDWAIDLLERLDVPPSLLPPVVPTGTRLGTVDAAVADGTALAGAEVVAAATHDTASAVAAVPFRRGDSAFISVGTWSLVGLEVMKPIISDSAFAANVTNEGGVGGTFRLMRNVTGLWLLHQCQQAWAREGRQHSFEELVRLAREAPAPRAFIEPNDPAFADPGDMPARIRAFCAHTGQAVPREPGTVVRCILESLALKHAQTIELLGSVTGTRPAEVHVVGGGARNELLCQWTANACGLPVLAGPEEATLIGNLLVQQMSLGEIDSLVDAREVVSSSMDTITYEPQDAQVWHEARERFATVVALPTLEVPA